MNVQKYLTIVVAGAILLGCGGESQQTETNEELVKTVNITTKNVEPTTFSSYLRVVGNVETSNDIMISAEVNGRVIDYRVEEGAQVKKGQTIVKIDDSKLKQEKARLEAMTSQTKEQYERLKKVYEEDGIGSELDYLNAKFAYEQSNSALESIKIDLENRFDILESNFKNPYIMDAKIITVLLDMYYNIGPALESKFPSFIKHIESYHKEMSKKSPNLKKIKNKIIKPMYDIHSINFTNRLIDDNNKVQDSFLKIELNKGFSFTQLRFERDLLSWRMNFSLVPFSNLSSWNFFIGIKSNFLQDLKYEQRRQPDQRLGN